MIYLSPIIARTPCFPLVLRKLNFFPVLCNKKVNFLENSCLQKIFRIKYIVEKATKNKSSNNQEYQHVLKVNFSQKKMAFKISPAQRSRPLCPPVSAVINRFELACGCLLLLPKWEGRLGPRCPKTVCPPFKPSGLFWNLHV